MSAHSPHNDVQPETNPLTNVTVRLGLNSSDFQLGREIFKPLPLSVSSEAQLPGLYVSSAEGHNRTGQNKTEHHPTQHHPIAHHAPEHHRPEHHATGHHAVQYHKPQHQAVQHHEPVSRAHGSWHSRPESHEASHAARLDTRIAPSRDYAPQSFSHPGFDMTAPYAGSAWVDRVLGETVDSLQGKSPQILERALDPRLGCARCVTQFGHRAYGLPITDSVANLESSMQARNFERVPMNAETISQMQPGDIIVGHRNGTMGGAPLHGHTAVYMGDGKIFNNNAFTKTMITESLSTFQQPLHDRSGHMHMNGYSDVWIYRPRANAA